MFIPISSEATPNPNTLKFTLPKTHFSKSYTFVKVANRTNSPIADKLFSIEGVDGVFLSDDFVTVTKTDLVNWEHLKAPVSEVITDFLLHNKPMVIAEEAVAPSGANDDNSIVKEIKELIESRVRPAVAQDGGDIEFHSFDEKEGIVYLRMHGSCSGCPSSTLTLKSGIENMLRHYIPEVNSVEPIE